MKLSLVLLEMSFFNRIVKRCFRLVAPLGESMQDTDSNQFHLECFWKMKMCLVFYDSVFT